jgi:membrane protein implicated in regulation of membrane protease activity
MTNDDSGGRLLLSGAVLLSLGGFAGFVYLFLLDLNVYWIILSPVILVLYEIPAVYLYWRYKRRKARRSGLADLPPPEEKDVE